MEAFYLLSKENNGINSTLCINRSTTNVMLKLKRNSAWKGIKMNKQIEFCWHKRKEVKSNVDVCYYVWSGDVRWYIWNAWPDKCSSGTPTISICCLGSRIICIWNKRVRETDDHSKTLISYLDRIMLSIASRKVLHPTALNKREWAKLQTSIAATRIAGATSWFRC